MCTSYDSSTGRHKIKYDDGDVREYDLATKNVEFETNADVVKFIKQDRRWKLTEHSAFVRALKKDRDAYRDKAVKNDAEARKNHAALLAERQISTDKYAALQDQIAQLTGFAPAVTTIAKCVADGAKAVHSYTSQSESAPTVGLGNAVRILETCCQGTTDTEHAGNTSGNEWSRRRLDCNTVTCPIAAEALQLASMADAAWLELSHTQDAVRSALATCHTVTEKEGSALQEKAVAARDTARKAFVAAAGSLSRTEGNRFREHRYHGCCRCRDE